MSKAFGNEPVILFDKNSKVMLKDRELNSSDCDCDCSGGDCACSLPSVSPFGSPEKLSLESQYMVSPESNFINLNEEYTIYYGPYQKPTVLNQDSKILRSFFSTPKKLSDIPNRLIDSWGQNLFNSSFANMLESRILVDELAELKIVENSELLTAWLHITDRCNLRCDYCYLPHLREDMSDDIGRASIDALLRSAKNNNYSSVRVKYAGGESLIRFGFIEELHTYAVETANRKGIALSGIILSNGTLLTSAIAQKIKRMNLSLMISLDGLGAVHDVQRRFAGGQGSFESVQQGIRIAISEGINPHISITVSGKNAHGLPELVKWILDNNLTFSINFYRENELSVKKDDLKLDEEKIISGMLAAYKVIEQNLPRRSLLNGLVDRANLSSAHSRTCGVGNNYMVFDFKGMVSKCQMQMKKPVTNVTVEDPLKLIQLDQIGIQNLPVEEKEGCKSCEWKHWCAGGCSLLTHSVTGRYDVKSPNCHIYKTIYPEAVRLEGLRLLKYADNLPV